MRKFIILALLAVVVLTQSTEDLNGLKDQLPMPNLDELKRIYGECYQKFTSADPCAEGLEQVQPEQPQEDQGEDQPAEEPAAEQPAAEEPAAEQPATEEPAAEQPAAEEPAAEQPAAEQPAAEQSDAESCALSWADFQKCTTDQYNTCEYKDMDGLKECLSRCNSLWKYVQKRMTDMGSCLSDSAYAMTSGKILTVSALVLALLAF